MAMTIALLPNRDSMLALLSTLYLAVRIAGFQTSAMPLGKFRTIAIQGLAETFSGSGVVQLLMSALSFLQSIVESTSPRPHFSALPALFHLSTSSLPPCCRACPSPGAMTMVPVRGTIFRRRLWRFGLWFCAGRYRKTAASFARHTLAS